MVTPLLGWQDDSRPYDCAQELEDCITACKKEATGMDSKGGLTERESDVRAVDKERQGKKRWAITNNGDIPRRRQHGKQLRVVVKVPYVYVQVWQS